MLPYMKNNIRPGQQDEADIWLRFRRGDQASFTHLHNTYYQELYFYALKITGDEHLSKNAIQELFLYMWKNRKHLGKVVSVKYYLLSSLKRHVRRLLQKEDQQRRFSTHYEERDFTFSPEDIIIRRETVALCKKNLLNALNALPPRQREIIYLRYVNELSLSEIATIMSLHYQSVLNCLGRAQCRLRNDLRTQAPSLFTKSDLSTDGTISIADVLLTAKSPGAKAI